jgi:hypothetical protein
MEAKGLEKGIFQENIGKMALRARRMDKCSDKEYLIFT